MKQSNSWKLLIVIVIACLLVIGWHYNARAEVGRPWLAEFSQGYVVVKVDDCEYRGYWFSVARVWIQRPDESSFALDLYWRGEGADGLCYWDGYSYPDQSGIYTLLFGSVRAGENLFDSGMDGTPRSWAPYQVMLPMVPR